MLTRLFVGGLFAGAAAGLIAALLQLAFVQPVLLHAELYESGALDHFGALSVSASQDVGGLDPLRDGLSVIFSMLVYCGYGLVLVALMSLAEERGARIDGRAGLLWGAAGFVAVHLAPAASLPPEVPGVAAAEITARQIWWLGTVLASALALWLAAFARGWTLWGLAIVLLIAPHAIGAPQPDAFTGSVPPELASLFAARALAVGLAAWVALGGFAGLIWSRRIGLEPADARP